MTIANAIARAWSDAAYKTKLVSNPQAALAEAGVSVPGGTTVKVIENTADTVHVVLPAAPAKANEMSIDELEKVAGGAGGIMVPESPNMAETSEASIVGATTTPTAGDQ